MTTDTSIDTVPPSTSDIYAGIRNILKLPPGLCLVKCDTLREGQSPLTEDQIRDWYESTRPGLGGQTASRPGPEQPGYGKPGQLQYPTSPGGDKPQQGRKHLLLL